MYLWKFAKEETQVLIRNQNEPEKLWSKDWTWLTVYRVKFSAHRRNRDCTKLRLSHSPGFDSLTAVGSAVKSNLLRIYLVLILGVAGAVLKVVASTTWLPPSNKYQRNSSFFSSHLFVRPVYFPLQVHGLIQHKRLKSVGDCTLGPSNNKQPSHSHGPYIYYIQGSSSGFR